MAKSKTFVISLGGSVMYPQDLDEKYLKDFHDFILRFVKRGYRFIIIVGGGKICRVYQEAALKIGKATDTERDWIGIKVIELNALLLKTILREKAYLTALADKNKVSASKKFPVTILRCGEPGHSSDFAAVQAAVDFKAHTVVNLGKPHYVYTANPDKDPAAKPLKDLAWREYFKIIPTKWTPGMSTPFDPIASRLAQKHGISVIVADGRNLDNFKKILEGKAFKGTMIKNA
ncbi:MAG: UMP kinase [Candidatus Pacebacteria bacterium]|nr:UMP kinase [Candidatus Paceibacterota bacterium]